MKIIVRGLAIFTLISSGLPVRAAESPTVLLQRARFAEETERDLAAAIRIYEQIIAETTANRNVIGDAYLLLAGCYLKQGKVADTIAQVEELLRQPNLDPGLISRAKAVLISVGYEPRDAIVMRNLGVPTSYIFDVSTDGRHLAYRAPRGGGLMIYETATGKSWQPFKGVEGFDPSDVESALFSPDSRLIAFEGSNTIYTSNLDGTNLTKIAKHASKDASSPWIVGWAESEGKLIVDTWELGKNGQEDDFYGYVDLKTGALTRTNLSWLVYTQSKFSPSGRYLAFTTAGDPVRSQVKVRNLASGIETTLLSREITRTVGWSRDESKFLFFSDRTGASALWALPMRDGLPAGEPELIQSNLVDTGGYHVTGDGRLYFPSAKPAESWVMTATIDPKSGELTSEPRRMTQSFPGKQRLPSWTADGKTLMMAVQRNNSPNLLAAVSNSGDYVAYPDSPPSGRSDWTFSSYSVSGDGKVALVQTRNPLTGKSGIYRLSLPAGKIDPVVLNESDGEMDSVQDGSPVFVPDGRSLYFVRRTYPKPADQSVWKDEIVLRELASGREEIVYSTPSSIAGLGGRDGLALSPDGNQLVIAERGTAAAPGGQAGPVLKIINRTNGTVRELARLARGAAPNFAWSGDGKYIVYSGQGKASIVDVESGKVIPLQLPMPVNSRITVHPDGRQIAFAITQAAGQSSLWVVEGLAAKLNPPAKPATK